MVRPAVPAGGKHSERHPALAAPLRHAERSPGGALPPRHLLQQPAAERATAHRGQGPRGASRGVRGPGAQGAQSAAQGAASGGERGLGVAGQGLLEDSAPGGAPDVSSHSFTVSASTHCGRFSGLGGILAAVEHCMLVGH